MGFYEYIRDHGIAIMKWNNDLKHYVFDHDPTSVIYFNQEHKFIHIKKDSRRVSVLDREDIGFNDELTIYVSSENNMIKTGARNLIRMFQKGWLATKQSCYMLLRDETKVSTTSGSIVNMRDLNTFQCAHKNKFIGRNENYIVALTRNRIDLQNNNTIKCRNDSIIDVEDSNVIVVTDQVKIQGGKGNIILCQDNCSITVDCDNTIIAGNNCDITCLGDNNFISCLDHCIINGKEYNTIFCSDNCTIIVNANSAVYGESECFLIQNDIRTINKFDYNYLFTTEIGHEELIPDHGMFNRAEYIDWFTRHVIGVYDSDEDEWVATWVYGTEDPEPVTPFDWLLPVGAPDDCEGIESWYTEEIFNETFDDCNPPMDSTAITTLSLNEPQLGVFCTGSTGNTGGVGIIGNGISPLPINTCDIGLQLAEEQGWYSTFDEYKESLDTTSFCILDSSSLCSFDTTSGCPFDTTTICEITKIEFARTIVMTGGTGGTGGTGSPNIPDSHLYVPICS